jgi:chromosome segregation ATPase
VQQTAKSGFYSSNFLLLFSSKIEFLISDVDTVQTQTLQSNLEQLQQTLTQAIQQQSDAVAAHNEAEIKLAERTRVAQETKEKLTQELEARSEQIEALQEQIDSDVAVREALTREVAQVFTFFFSLSSLLVRLYFSNGSFLD